MRAEHIYNLYEDIREKDYVIASYYMELFPREDPYEKAKKFAVGQTIGTWVPVPGITEEMREKYMGKVIQIYDIPPADLSVQMEKEEIWPYIIQIAYPMEHFQKQFPLLLTTLLGNDASTSAQAKLVDLQLPKKLLQEFSGPRFGIQGLRSLCAVEARPMLLNMIKPCTGFTPDVGAKIFYETALGGVDFIKDDELLGNPDYCPLEERIRAYEKASEAAYERSGKKTIYIPNITDNAGQLLDNGRRAAAAGARMVMVNFAAVGYSMLQALTEALEIPVFGHYAGSGPLYEGRDTGISSPLAVGKLPRLLGADGVMINTPYGGYPLKRQKYLRTHHELTLPLGHIKPALTTVGGGVNPGFAGKLVKDLGRDIMLAPGGAVQGHPMGAAAGVRAMLQAIEAQEKGIPIDEAAKEHEELKRAVELWGYLPV